MFDWLPRWGLVVWGAALAILIHWVPSPARAQNLITNPGFEQGTTGWYAFAGAGSLTAPTTLPHAGARSGRVSNRTQAYQGVAQNMRGVLSSGSSYWVSAWVRLENVASDNVILTMLQKDGAGTRYFPIAQAQSTNSAWSKLSGIFALDATGTLSELTLYVEGPKAGVNFYADDVSVTALGDWRAEADSRIEQTRKRDVRIRVVDQYGRPRPQLPVAVRQTGHRFAFGSAITASALADTRYTDYFREHFEWAVPENEAKWPQVESRQGVLNYGPMDDIAAFCNQNGIALRGHNVFWAVEEFVPSWARALPDASLQAAMLSRVNDIVGRYKDVFVHWDVNNEMLHGAYYENRFGAGINTWMFQQAHQIDPDCLLFVNDYNVVAGPETEAYKTQITGLLAAGTPVHGIGAQCHFGSAAAVNPYLIKMRLDSLAELGLPIWCTEFDVVAADPAVRADCLETFYRVAFSHPAVEGVLMWGFWAGRHWLGADAALVDLDWTVNAAGLRYESLLSQWTSSASGVTDGDGRLEFRGVHGAYEITLSPSATEVENRLLAVDPGVGVQDSVFVVPVRVYDFDGDRDVDLDDFAHLQNCLTIVGDSLPVECQDADLDKDKAVDRDDVRLFIRCVSGAGIDADPACAEQ